MTIPTTIITPGTLFVQSSQSTSMTILDIPRLAMATSDLEQSSYYHYSRPINGPNGPNNKTLIFESPRTIMSRMTTGTGATGSILQLPAPGVNASYQLQFFAPYVTCETANSSTAAMIQQAMYQLASNETGMKMEYNGYFAYVPDETPERRGLPNQREANASLSSNELWLSYRVNATELWDTRTSLYPKCPVTEYLTCRLMNATYNLNVTFENGNQVITHEAFTDLKPVQYPGAVVDSTKAGELSKLSYASYFWAFSELLTGSMALYAQNASDMNGRWYNVIEGNLQDTALLGSSDLDCFFATGWMYYNTSYRAPSGQRRRDMDFAGRRKLGELIPELSANVTIGLLSNDLLS
jgi:hypothetical protein